MSTKKFITAICLTALAAAGVFWGCEGDPGPIGPQGTQGPVGPSDLNIQAVLMVANIEVKAAQQGTFAMSVYNAASIPKVTLNGTIVRPDEGWLIDGAPADAGKVTGVIESLAGRSAGWPTSASLAGS